MTTISVVIPCLNEEKYLGKLLDDLLAQTKKPDEVIVSDCNSDDKTIQVAESYKDKLPMKVAHSTTRSPGAARNAGAQTSSSQYLLFVDADMHIGSNLLETIVSSLEKRPVDFVTPSYKSDGKHFADVFNVWIVNFWMAFAMKFRHHPTFTGGVMCVSKKLYVELGGFNEKMNSGEDIEYMHRLRRNKVSFTYLNSLKAVTSSRRFQNHSTLAGFWQLFIENTTFGNKILQPKLARHGKQKQYGHYK